ncbi:hypothetical protein BHE74_00011248 [Ensete ventricosum]|nr:hypothetical protein GW17_00018154 [Ensete ventricosum]RWW80407.1 hypothetical protein BHE74_00011248 [Ensete ventricosum]
MALQRSRCKLANSLKFLLPRSASYLHSHATSFGTTDHDLRKSEKKKKVNWLVMSSVVLVTKLCPFPGMKHLDVAGGTDILSAGDIAFRVLENIRSVSRRAMQDGLAETEEQTQIYICDINPNMLNIGKKRAIERGLLLLYFPRVGFAEDRYLHWVEGDAEALSFEDESMDGYTIGFGIRNVTHIEKALAEAYR